MFTVAEATDRSQRNSRPALTVDDLHGLFDQAPFGVLAIGPDGFIEYVNPRQCENSSLPAESFVGKEYRPTFGPTIEKPGLLRRYDLLVEAGVPFEATLLDYKRHIDNVSIAFSLRGYRADPWILLVTTVEHVLADQQARYRQLFENANDGIFILSREGRYTTANHKWAEIVGLPLHEIIGKTTEIFLPGRFAQSLERLEQMMREGHLGPYELEIATPNGAKVLSLNGFALLEDGKPVGVVNIARDITKEHRHAEELREARDKALEASRLKSSFLANMSHEIRTPLNIMLGYGSLLAEDAEARGDSEEIEMIHGMRSAGQRLENTIDSILDISKIESGLLDMRPQRAELARVTERQVSNFLPIAGAKGLSLSCAIGEPGAVVTFDLHCLDNALMNLIDNAIKFTPRGGEVRVELGRDSDGRPCLHVRDTGIGMGAAFLLQIGVPFVQEDSGSTRRFEGTGLGLALTRRYLELNGARLSVESEKGKGSLFTIHFTTEIESHPGVMATTANGGRSQAFSADLARSRVLLVEDDEQTRGYMKRLLGREYELFLAANAEEASSFLRTSHVDLVLMDISLSGAKDGLELTQELRGDPRWKDLPIIALTAHAFPEDQQRALAAGCDDYVAKPFAPRDLMAKMSTLLAPQGNRIPSDPSLH